MGLDSSRRSAFDLRLPDGDGFVPFAEPLVHRRQPQRDSEYGVGTPQCMQRFLEAGAGQGGFVGLFEEIGHAKAFGRIGEVAVQRLCGHPAKPPQQSAKRGDVLDMMIENLDHALAAHAAHKIEKNARHEGSGHVAPAFDAENGSFDAAERAILQPVAPKAARQMQQVEMRRLPDRAGAMKDEASAQQRDIEGFAIVGDQRPEFGGALAESANQRFFLVVILHAILLDDEFLAGEVAQTDKKDIRPRAAGKPRGFRVEKGDGFERNGEKRIVARQIGQDRRAQPARFFAQRKAHAAANRRAIERQASDNPRNRAGRCRDAFAPGKRFGEIVLPGALGPRPVFQIGAAKELSFQLFEQRLARGVAIRVGFGALDFSRQPHFQAAKRGALSRLAFEFGRRVRGGRLAGCRFRLARIRRGGQVRGAKKPAVQLGQQGLLPLPFALAVCSIAHNAKRRLGIMQGRQTKASVRAPPFLPARRRATRR
ncbi:MAG: hypothetical protein BWZ10_02641 [candidate division BRC1 bacterium ADurb.BinA364]|nr:MAG: hypothetical protein BWZ10_02641 [candidate division BRC1 bacterium ADurb.BinA364]